jgi:selT/selW/selH-like putative selenoprotein
VELIRGDDGIFDVALDGRRVFSKHEAGRFPEESEALALLREAAGG